MAFIFVRNHKHHKTYYVGYYHDGRFFRQKIGRSKRLADKAKGDIEAKLERGEGGLLRKDYSLHKFFEEYRQRTEAVQSTAYRKRCKTVIDNFLRFLKLKRPYLTRLSQIRPGVIEEYQRFRLSEGNAKTGKPITRRTANIEVSTLKTFLNRAVKWDMLSGNPLRDVEYLKEDDSKKVRALDEHEVHRLLEDANGWFRPVLITAVYTGLREGELINLEWDDVDLDKQVIRVQRKPHWIPKSSGGSIRERDVAIPAELADFLRDHRRASDNPDNWVFHNKDGEQLKPGLRKALMRLTAKCGFPDVTQFHALRHTYTTQLIEACKDLSVAQAQLGHADIRTTMQYSDMTDERKRKAVEMLHFGVGGEGRTK